MKLRVESTYRGSVEQTFASHIEKSVREEACRQSGAVSWEVTVQHGAEGAVKVTVDRTMEPDLPEAIRKFVGNKVTIRQVETWAPPAADGSRHAHVQLDILRQPAGMTGSAVLTPAGTGSTELVTGDVKVNVPIIGKRFEPDIAKVISSALKIEQRVSDEWVQAQA